MRPLLPPRLLLPLLPPGSQPRHRLPLVNRKIVLQIYRLLTSTGTLAHLKDVGQLPEGRCYCDMCTLCFFLGRVITGRGGYRCVFN